MSPLAKAPGLTRTTAGIGAPIPVRLVHLGLGAFHRSHQAWYTAAVDTEGEWGIAAFTGRSPAAADAISAQDGLYTLIERNEEGDRFEVVKSISAAFHGTDIAHLARLLAAPTTAVVTMTITEPGYHLGADGTLDDAAPAVQQDLAALRAWKREVDGETVEGSLPLPETLVTVGARLTVGLDARRTAAAGPLAVVSCDNLSGNGRAAAETVLGFARRISDELAVWIEGNVSFVDSSVDRITPATTNDDVESVVLATGLRDSTPVVAEPFHSWVLSGEFPAGRPAWERAGAIFTDDIEPFERRKLWLLNGAHSLLAYAGQLRGHETVADAVRDPQCARWLEDFWDEAAAHLTDSELAVPAYRQALLQRFGNSRIRHRLEQIGGEGSAKLRVRAVPVLLAERAAGRDGAAAARIIAAWIDSLAAGYAADIPPADAAGDQIEQIFASSDDHPEKDLTGALVRLLDTSLDDSVISLVRELRGTYQN